MNSADISSPDLSDAQKCLALLSSLPLTKLSQAHETLAHLLGGMQATPPAPTAYLEVLETARTSLAFVQEEMADRYAQSALPLGSREDETLRRVVGLWQAMARAYDQVARAAGKDADHPGRLELICQRRIHYSGKAILEYFRARREVPKGLWSDLHGYYSAAQECGVAQAGVTEILNDAAHPQSSAQAYAAMLLADLGDPYGRGPLEFGWLVRWSQRFASFTEIGELAAGSGGHGYAVDLTHDHGPVPLETLERNAHVRQLATPRLSAELHQVLAQLKNKRSPAQLGFGDDCFEPACSRLLVSLYRPWCLAARPRRFQRRKASGNAQLCYGFEAIHFYVSGEEFAQPEHMRVYSREKFETATTFRYQLDPSEHLRARADQAGYTLENWAVSDQSASGFRLLRFGAGVRIEHGQLLGLRPADGGCVLLCQVRWLMYLSSGALMIGVFVLPGAPRAAAARQRGIRSPAERYSRVFLLPPMPALKQVATMVLPKGWFQPGRITEIYTNHCVEVRLLEAVTQGSDFDRVSFEALKPFGSSQTPRGAAESGP